MNTLHEFALVTQTQEYLVGLLGMVLFVPFWRLVTRKRKIRDRGVKALSLLLLIFGLALPGVSAALPKTGCSECHACTNPTQDDPCLKACPRPRAVKKEIDRGPESVILSELENEYQPVYFEHRLHAEMSAMGGECTDCHHFSEARGITSCKECHPVSAADEELNQPSLKGAYHRQCLGCHREWSGETSCEVCHVKKGAEVTETPHKLPALQEPVKKVWASSYGGGTKVTLFHRNHTVKYGIECSSCHHAEGCGSCHQRGSTTMQVRHSESALHDICNSCHAEMSCDQCHRKEEAAEFTHDRTGWPLKSYHRQLSCRRCHGNPHHFTKPSPECSGCHSDWTAANFQHARTGLALDETHVALACDDCHTNGRYSDPPSCAKCHDPDIVCPTRLPGSYTGEKP